MGISDSVAFRYSQPVKIMAKTKKIKSKLGVFVFLAGALSFPFLNSLFRSITTSFA
jgi:hypothetical protein